MEKFQEPPIEQKPVARWTVCPPLDPHRIQGLSLQRKHGMVTARRRGGAVEPYIHRRWGSRGTVTSSAAGAPLSHLVGPVALYGRPRRTGPLARVAPAPSQTPVACRASHGLLLESTESRAGQLGSAVHAFGRSVVVRLHCNKLFFLSFRYCFIFVTFCSCFFSLL